MRVEPHKEGQRINIVLRNGMTTSKNKGKQPKEDRWARKAPDKESSFDLNHTKETFMEENKSFIEASTSSSQDKTLEASVTQEVDPSILATFLENSMKLLHDRRVVEGLQDLIDKCANKENTPLEHHTVRNIGKHKAWTWCEMRLTTHIGDYEMDQAILDLGFDANVLPKHTCERMGRPTLQWSQN